MGRCWRQAVRPGRMGGRLQASSSGKVTVAAATAAVAEAKPRVIPRLPGRPPPPRTGIFPAV